MADVVLDAFAQAVGSALVCSGRSKSLHTLDDLLQGIRATKILVTQ
ncbi:hypothetical protein PCS_01427 [Desulfocurvibacter africanus PCS]|uniref:Uncharacterized protein n=1 Tax=Desulfocurvibacter africanus PCS TaxID=1262666 RepID=M5PTU9_DESAF|nr:hypothetical protein PCS_01427 [Desulfocurvibacter africanus PCS]